MIFDYLIDVAPPPLRAWMGAHTAPVVLAIEAATKPLRTSKRVADTVARLVQAWWNDNGQSTDLNGLTEDHAGYVASYLFDEHGPQLSRNYGITSEAQLAPLVWTALRAMQTTEPEGVSLWTDAPRDYDHRGVFRSGDRFTWTISDPPMILTRVVIPSSMDADWQAQRYASGGHTVFDAERLEKERVYEAKKALNAQWAGPIATMQKAIAEAADLIPAKRDDGYWQHGIRWVPTYDEKTGRSYPRPLEHGPAADPHRAQELLQSVMIGVRKLPKAVQDEHWRLRADAIDLLKLAKYNIDKRKEEIAAQDRKAKDDRKAIGKALKMALDAAAAAGLGAGAILVPTAYSKYRDTWVPNVEASSLGRALTWPPDADGYVETQTGRVRMASPSALVATYMLTETTPPGLEVPAAVWNAGANAKVTRFEVEGAPYFMWTPEGYYKDPIVTGVDGVPLRKNTRVYRIVTAGGPRESQDALLDRAIIADVAERGIPTTWRDLGVAHPADPATIIPIKVIAPETKGRGLVGYRVSHQGEGKNADITVWTRYPKVERKGGPLWRVAP